LRQRKKPAEQQVFFTSENGINKAC
jgi:hypothetical protein